MGNTARQTKTEETYMDRMVKTPEDIPSLSVFDFRSPRSASCINANPDMDGPPGEVYSKFSTMREHEKKWKDENCRSRGFNPISVKLQHENITGNKRVLFLVSCPRSGIETDKEPRFDNDTRGRTYNKFRLSAHPQRLDTIARAIVSQKTKFDDFAVFNFFTMPINQVPESLQNEFVKDSHSRLKSFIKKYRPSSIVVADVYLYDYFFKNSATASSDDGHVKVSMVLGRIQNVEGYNRGGESAQPIPFVPSLPLFELTQPFGDTATNNATLLGFFRRHIRTASRQKDDYTLDLTDVKRHVIDDMRKFKKFMKILRACRTPCIDTETDNLSRTQNTLLTMQFATDDKTAFFLPLWHVDTPFSGEELEKIRATLCEYFESGESKYLIMHNAKFDGTRARSELGVRFLAHNLYDTMGGEFALDENRKHLNDVIPQQLRPYSLEHLTFEYGSDIYLHGELGKDDRAKMADQKLVDIEGYGWKDVIVPFQIHTFQRHRARREGDKNFVRTVTHIISDILHVFIEMELNGTLIDSEYLMKMRSADSMFSETLKSLDRKLQKSKYAQEANLLVLKKKGAPTAGGMFGGVPWVLNLSSPVARNFLFFDVMKIVPNKFVVEEEEDGSWSTYPSISKGSGFQDEFAHIEEVQILSEFNAIAKLKGTFINGIAKALAEDPDGKDGHIRTTYSYVSVVTGRTSSSKPGLQQIPSRGDLAKLIKRQFIASYGHAFIGQDYSAQEMRGWGNAAKDKGMIANFYAGMRMRRIQRLSILTDEAILGREAAFTDKIVAQCEKKGKDWAKLPSNKRISIIKIKYKNKRIDKDLRDYLLLLIKLGVEGDVHRLNYQLFFGVKADQVTGEQRGSVKAVAFGVLYGKMAKALAVDVKVKGSEEQQERLKRLTQDLERIEMKLEEAA